MSNVYALLVGIDFYANPRQAPHLRGCVTDVEGTHYLLVNKLGIPDANILMLTARGDRAESAELLATRANIIRGWQEHLGQAGPGDYVFFNYSGHGSLTPSNDPAEIDGFDEGLVAHDCRMPGIYDILDKELAVLIQEVEAKGAHVSVFLDCCHSGGGTRGEADRCEDGQPLVRQCLADERIRPPESILEGVSSLPAATRSAKAGPSGWARISEHVLLAGCRDEELSHEYRSPENGAWQGATTYFFQKALNNYHADMTWQDIHDFVYPRVHAVYSRQSPQLEGPRNQKLFGGLAQPVEGYLRVLGVENQSHIKVDGGAAIGLAPEGRLALYPLQSDLQGKPFTKATIEEVKVDHAWARLDEPTAVEIGSRIKIMRPGQIVQRYGVMVDDPMIQEPINSSPFLQSVNSGSEETATFWITTENGCYITRDATGTQLVNEAPPATPEGCATLINTVEHLAVYRNVQLLHNPVLDSDLRGAVKIEGVTFTEFTRGGTRSSPKVPKDPKPIREGGGESVIESGQKVSLSIRNVSNEPLYIALFSLDSNFGIKRLYPKESSYRTIAPNKEIPYNTRLSIDNPYLAKGIESLKIFVTRNPTSFDVLEMPTLNKGVVNKGGTRASGGTALSQLLNAARHDGTRPAEALDDDDGDETMHHWMTAQLDITVLAPTIETQLTTGQRHISVNDEMGLSLHKPEAFAGAITVSSVTQASRGVEIEGCTSLPPLFDTPEAAQAFRPVRFGEGTRSSEQSPMVLLIDADVTQLASIKPDNPLQLTVMVDDDDELRGVVPIAYDGEFYYPVGQQIESSNISGTRATIAPGKREISVQINFLPAPLAQPSEEANSTRDLKRTARLFLYKVFGRELPADTGVRKSRLAGGKLCYETVGKADIHNAKRVALMVHGFTSDTKWLAVKLWPMVQSVGRYDLCLTYDYESFATGIKENGRLLAVALEELGFGPEDDVQLDIFCHSMGTQVCRALVEIWGGDAYVDRAFMGGPPNAGSPLAGVRKFIPWLSTILLNTTNSLGTTVPISLFASWLLKSVASNGQGMIDLDTDSSFYTEINEHGRGVSSVPYYIQIGDNSASPQDWNRLYEKAMQTFDIGLDRLFGGDHDLAVGLNSAKAIPCYALERLPGNHFQYFHSEEGWPSLKVWLEE